MIIDEIEFNYNIESIDIESATMVVQYTPVDPNLMPMKLNVMFVEHRAARPDPETGGHIFFNVAETFEEHKEHSIKAAAPIALWRRQKLLLDNL